MINKLFSELMLVCWLCSRGYEAALHKVFDKGAERDLHGVLGLAQRYFPFINETYFKGFEELKTASEEVVGLQVREVPMPALLLGAYLPETATQKGTIFINSQILPVFWLSTLAHELSHAVVYRYFKEAGATLHANRLRYRISQFKEDLQDKEEVMADVLTAIGTYTRSDLCSIFYAEKTGRNQDQFTRLSVRDLWKAFKHLKQNYPEVTRNFIFTRDVFLNIALIVHFLRLRLFVYKKFAL